MNCYLISCSHPINITGFVKYVYCVMAERSASFIMFPPFIVVEYSSNPKMPRYKRSCSYHTHLGMETFPEAAGTRHNKDHSGKTFFKTCLSSQPGAVYTRLEIIISYTN